METEITKVLVVNWSHLVYVLPVLAVGCLLKKAAGATWGKRSEIWVARKKAITIVFWSLAGLSAVGIGIDANIGFTPDFVRERMVDGSLVPIMEQDIAPEDAINLPGKWKDLLHQLEQNEYVETSVLTLRSFANEHAAGEPLLPASGFDQIMDCLYEACGCRGHGSADTCPRQVARNELGKYVTPFPLEPAIATLFTTKCRDSNDAGGTQLARSTP